MNLFVASLLAQDGLTNGAIYALLALVLVMVFSVTRVILVPQGEVVSFGALTLAALQGGGVPNTVWLLVGGGLAVAALDVIDYLRGARERARLASAAWHVVLPALVLGVTTVLAPMQPPQWVLITLALLIVAPLGPIMYRLAFQPLGNASVLVLLIVAVAVHFVLTGLGLLFFGAEGVRTPPLVSGQIQVGGIFLSWQALFIVLVASALIAALFAFFGRTLSGKALRATAYNRVGARLVGISTAGAGMLAFGLAGLIGAASGILTAPITTVYYDTGFLIGLKGFIAAIVGGLASYPLAAAGAVAIGLLESYSSFWASAFKDAIVFALIIPILLWRNLVSKPVEEDDEE